MVAIHCNGKVFESVEAIVFDKDGTLANSQTFLIHLAEQRANAVEALVPNLKSAILGAFGVKQGKMDLAGLMAVGTREENETAIATLITQTGLNWINARSIARTAFQQADQHLPRKADLTPPFPGIPELLATCQSIKLGILSSDTEENVRDFVDRYDLTHFFQAQMGARSGLSKPNPELFKMICAELEVLPSHTLVIGDAIADIQLANLGGAIASIGITWGGVTEAQFNHATAIAHNTCDIQLRIVN